MAIQCQSVNALRTVRHLTATQPCPPDASMPSAQGPKDSTIQALVLPSPSRRNDPARHAARRDIRRRSAGEGTGLRPHWISRRIRAGPCSTTTPCGAACRIASLRPTLLIFVVITLPPLRFSSVARAAAIAPQYRVRDHAFVLYHSTFVPICNSAKEFWRNVNAITNLRRRPVRPYGRYAGAPANLRMVNVPNDGGRQHKMSA